MFDNEHGLGATPNNGNVKYLGFAIFISPSEFLELAAPGDRQKTAKDIVELMKNRTPIAAPFLSVKYNEKEFARGEPLKVEVVGHEGRARMTAIQTINGDSMKIPVHVIPRGETRAHHFNHKFFEELRKNGIVPEREDAPKSVDIGKIYWMDKSI